MWEQRRQQWLAKTWERFVHGWSICKHKIEYLKMDYKREGREALIENPSVAWFLTGVFHVLVLHEYGLSVARFSHFFPQEKPESCVVNVKAFDFLILTTKQTVCRPNKAQWCTRFSQSTARWRLWVQKFSGAKNPNALAGTFKGLGWLVLGHCW